MSIFKIGVKNESLLSRCVKCNSPDLIIIDKEIAKENL